MGMARAEPTPPAKLTFVSWLCVRFGSRQVGGMTVPDKCVNR